MAIGHSVGAGLLRQRQLERRADPPSEIQAASWRSALGSHSIISRTAEGQAVRADRHGPEGFGPRALRSPENPAPQSIGRHRIDSALAAHGQGRCQENGAEGRYHSRYFLFAFDCAFEPGDQQLALVRRHVGHVARQHRVAAPRLYRSRGHARQFLRRFRRRRPSAAELGLHRQVRRREHGTARRDQLLDGRKVCVSDETAGGGGDGFCRSILLPVSTFGTVESRMIRMKMTTVAIRSGRATLAGVRRVEPVADGDAHQEDQRRNHPVVKAVPKASRSSFRQHRRR